MEPLDLQFFQEQILIFPAAAELASSLLKFFWIEVVQALKNKF